MNIKRTLYYSLVQFRVNPANEACGVEHLGFVLGFTTDRYRAVSLAIRGALNPEFMNELDPLSREILENRADIIKAEIERACSSQASPEHVLRAVSDANQWSLYVTQPQVTEMTGEVPDAASVARVAEEYVLELFREKHWLPVIPSYQEPQVRSYEFTDALSYQPDCNEETTLGHGIIPPPWMLEPKTWVLPVT